MPANAEVLDAIDELADTYTGDRRWRIEHAQIVDPADLPRFAQHGIVASMQPVHQTSDRLMAEGAAWAEPAWPVRLCVEDDGGGKGAAGVRLRRSGRIARSVHRASRSRSPARDETGQPSGGWQPQQAITREQALAAYTSGAAYAGFADGTLRASLRPAKHADFLVIDHDPLLASPEEIRRHQGARSVAQRAAGDRHHRPRPPPRPRRNSTRRTPKRR